MENRLVTIIISLYIACLLYTQAFFVKVLTLLKGSDQLFWNHLIIFIIFFLGVYFVLSRYISVDEDSGVKRVLKLILYFILILGLIIAILYHIVPIAPVYHLPQVLDQFFLADRMFTIWLFAPLVILFF